MIFLINASQELVVQWIPTCFISPLQICPDHPIGPWSLFPLHHLPDPTTRRHCPSHRPHLQLVGVSCTVHLPTQTIYICGNNTLSQSLAGNPHGWLCWFIECYILTSMTCTVHCFCPSLCPRLRHRPWRGDLSTSQLSKASHRLGKCHTISLWLFGWSSNIATAHRSAAQTRHQFMKPWLIKTSPIKKTTGNKSEGPRPSVVATSHNATITPHCPARCLVIPWCSLQLWTKINQLTHCVWKITSSINIHQPAQQVLSHDRTIQLSQQHSRRCGRKKAEHCVVERLVGMRRNLPQCSVFSRCQLLLDVNFMNLQGSDP